MTTAFDRLRIAPGAAYGIVGDEVLVLIGATGRAEVPKVWDLVEGGASFDQVLDALVAQGVSALPDLAMVASRGEATRVLVRGSADVRVTTASGEVAVSSAPGTTWADQVHLGVTGLRIDLGAIDGAQTPVQSSLFRASALEYGAPAAPADDSGSPAAAVADPAPAPAAEVPAPADAIHAAPAPAEAAPVEAAPVEAAPVEAAPVEATPAEVAQPDDGPGEPASDPAGDASPEPTPPAPAAEDGDPGFLITAPPELGAEGGGAHEAPAPLANAVASLVFSTGDVIAVDRAVLVGRAPEARRFASHDQPRLVTVPSANQEISSTHVEFRPGTGVDHGSAVVTDLGSTNGTVLVQPGLPPEDLQPGMAVSLIPGAVLDLGDGVTIQVSNP